MATKRPKVCPPAATETPGVWLIDHPSSPSPFGVQWRERMWDPVTKLEREKKRTEFFTSEADRDKRRRAIYADKLAGRATDLPREEQEEWRAFKAAAAGVDWRVIFANHQSWVEHTGVKTHGMTVAKFYERYKTECQARVARGEMSKDSLSHKTTLLDDLISSFGHFALSEPSPDKVEKWLDDLGNASPFTFNGHRKIIFAFFNEAVNASLIPHNPIRKLRRRRAIVDNRKRILTPAQAAQLFLTAHTDERFRPALARLALEAFLGIRYSSAHRLKKEDVRTAERAIMLPASQLKTGQESGEGHLVDSAPDQIWEWIASAPDSGWSLTERQYMELKSLLFVRAGVPHPKNCLRKSFATYDLAAHKNPGRTAYLLGHTNQRELWRSYKGNASKADGELYQKITPQTCALIARGELPHGPNQPQTMPARPGGSASGAFLPHTS